MQNNHFLVKFQRVFFNLFPTYFAGLKMLSAYYDCCIYTSALQTRFFFVEANSMDPDQTASKEQSDLGPNCLHAI